MTDSVGIILALSATTIIGLGLGLGLAIASKIFKVEKDAKLESLEASLPGINCGSCGYASCASYAEAISNDNESDLTLCKPGGSSTLSSLCSIMGVKMEKPTEKMVAHVHCWGGHNEAKLKYNYQGLEDCTAHASLFGGAKECKYGCLGGGSCLKVCPVDAIKILPRGVASIDKEICIACGKCLDICPSSVIKMIPYDAEWMVACNSKDKPKITKNNCKVGCIGCKICEKKFPESGFKVENFLCTTDYTIKGKDQDGAAKACPMKCIIPIEGKNKF